jgi:hypothetical protein
MLSSSTRTRNQESIPLIFTAKFTVQNARKMRPVSTTQKRAGPNNLVVEHTLSPSFYEYKKQKCQLQVKLMVIATEFCYLKFVVCQVSQCSRHFF